MNQVSKKNFHFIGIGGSGMSGIAHLCLKEGHKVSGSDLKSSMATSRLESQGAVIHFPHNRTNIQEEPVVVVSSAIPETNVELRTAREMGLVVKKRAEVLGWFMKGRSGISVAGCHGKTTTTSIVSSILTVAGLDPSTVVGGEASHVGGNAKFGHGKYLVAEADESDASFLCLPSEYSIITNVDDDHLEHYGSYENILNSFLKFMNQTGSLVVACGDDEDLYKLTKQTTTEVVTYGFSKELDYIIEDLELGAEETHFKLSSKDFQSIEFKIKSPGVHNVLNSVASIALCHQLGVAVEHLQEGVLNFQGVQRRFELISKDRGVRIFDDYAHHPEEVRATLLAARQRLKDSNGKLVVCFQPHRYSRIKHLAHDFGKAFDLVDFLFLAPVYAAGEVNVDHVSSWDIAKHLSMAPEKFEVMDQKKMNELPHRLKEDLKSGDLFLTMGAGDITRFGRELKL